YPLFFRTMSSSARFCLFLLLSTLAMGAAAPSREKRQAPVPAPAPGLTTSLTNPITDVISLFFNLYVSFLNAIPFVGPLMGGAVGAFNPGNIIKMGANTVD
ncbi:hypothetical protein PENTCL1PPCAC_1992, partial [Pristionchus entomophagus]